MAGHCRDPGAHSSSCAYVRTWLDGVDRLHWIFASSGCSTLSWSTELIGGALVIGVGQPVCLVELAAELVGGVGHRRVGHPVRLAELVGGVSH
jgi:hypothetical protein